jgi:hypothetical protein
MGSRDTFLRDRSGTEGTMMTEGSLYENEIADTNVSSLEVMEKKLRAEQGMLVERIKDVSVLYRLIRRN